jgi:hypothetical protein
MTLFVAILPLAIISLESTIFHVSLVGIVARRAVIIIETLFTYTVAPSLVIPVAAFILIALVVNEFTFSVLQAPLEISFEL